MKLCSLKENRTGYHYIKIILSEINHTPKEKYARFLSFAESRPKNDVDEKGGLFVRGQTTGAGKSKGNGDG
jgi:hypothetical protein